MRRPLLPFLIVLLAGTAAGREPRPFDFGGRWTGSIRVERRRFVLTGDFTSTGAATFIGTVTVDGPNGTVTCSANGERRRRTTIALTCADGTAAALAGRLSTRRGTVRGAARLSKGDERSRGKFKIEKQAAVAAR